MPGTHNKTLTTREASIMLGVSLRTVQLWVEAGVLAAWKTQGGHRRIALKSLEKVLAEREAVLNLKHSARQNIMHLLPANSTLKVLIAEDNQVYREWLEFYFKNLNMPVNISIVSNGFECLISLGKLQPDIMIADLNMSRINCFDMIRYLTADSCHDAIEIIALTDLTQEDIDKKGGLPQRVKLFFKPFSFKQLERIVDDLIKRKSV